MRFWKTVTSFLYVTTQVAALVWVSVSYGIAVYSTVALGQPFPVVELSSKAIDALLSVGALKTVSNMVEHNDGWLFGNSRKGGEEDGGECVQPEDGEEGVG